MLGWYKQLRKEHGSFMWGNFKKVFFAEAFDGTWTMAMLAASVTGRSVEVFVGAILGLLFIQIIATELGSRLHGKLPSPEVVGRVVGSIFVALGALFLLRAAELISVDPTKFLYSVKDLPAIVFIPAIMMLIAGFEIFDKTAAVTLHTSATSGKGRKMATLISSMEGLIVANILGVLFLGNVISSLMSPSTVEWVSGIIFVVIGAYLIIGKSTILGWIGRGPKEEEEELDPLMRVDVILPREEVDTTDDD